MANAFLMESMDPQTLDPQNWAFLAFPTKNWTSTLKPTPPLKKKLQEIPAPTKKSAYFSTKNWTSNKHLKNNNIKKCPTLKQQKISQNLRDYFSNHFIFISQNISSPPVHPSCFPTPQLREVPCFIRTKARWGSMWMLCPGRGWDFWWIFGWMFGRFQKFWWIFWGNLWDLRGVGEFDGNLVENDWECLDLGKVITFPIQNFLGWNVSASKLYHQSNFRCSRISPNLSTIFEIYRSIGSSTTTSPWSLTASQFCPLLEKVAKLERISNCRLPWFVGAFPGLKAVGFLGIFFISEVSPNGPLGKAKKKSLEGLGMDH